MALVAAYPVPAFAAFVLAAIPVAIAIWAPGGLFFVGFFWSLLFTGCSSWLTVVIMRQQHVFHDPIVTMDEASKTNASAHAPAPATGNARDFRRG